MNLYPLQSTSFLSYLFFFLKVLSLISSPGVRRGKTAVDLLPVLHRRLLSWFQTSEIQEGQGNFKTTLTIYSI